MPCCCANTQASAEQFRNALVQILIDGLALLLVGRFSLLNTLGLSLAALLIILARNGSHHFHQHRVDCSQHPTGELVALGVLHSLMAGWQIERDDAQPLGVDRCLELLPVLHWQAGESVNRLHQQHVTLARIFAQVQQLGPVRRGAAGILQVHARNDLVVVCGKLLERSPGAAGVLLFGRCSEVCADEHAVRIS